MEQKNYELERRAVRITPPPSQVDIIVNLDGEHYADAKIVDMSTMGIGLHLSLDPGDKSLKLLFKKPQVLSGLEIGAVTRNKKIISGENGKDVYFVGLEYVFSSSDQQNLLLRWLTTYFQDQLQAEGGLPAYARSSGQSTQYGAKTETLLTRFPQQEAELEQAFLLLQPLSIHHALLQTKYFLGIHKDAIVGVVPLMMDTMPFKLPADAFFSTYLNKLRAQNCRIGEIATHRFNEENELLKQQPSMILRKLNILFSLFINMVIYSSRYASLTDLVVIAPPSLQEFYRLWFFQDLRDEVDLNLLKQGAGLENSRFMRLDLQTLKPKLAEKRPELLAQLIDMEQSPKVMNNFQLSFYPHKGFLEKWFSRPRNLFSQLEGNQKAYFQMLVPELGL
ncbi:MAG: PilZ domain-containing protein [Candidatus Omnitrophica bacterium]|nr:PilZ domain-containing protein [Candidatus Omnitrophota bacterium]